jgi:hypothetical protein
MVRRGCTPAIFAARIKPQPDHTGRAKILTFPAGKVR